MPLRDHHRPPLSDRRDWTGVHGGWPMKMIDHLLPQLPEGYYAEPTVSLGSSRSVDVGAREDVASGRAWSDDGGGTATLTSRWVEADPFLAVDADIPVEDLFEILVYEDGRQLVAAIELVSPSNKDRPESRRAFVGKCAALLAREVCVTVIDTVTKYDFNLFGELLESIGQPPPSDAPALYAVTCRLIRDQRPQLRAWGGPLVLGRPLPRLPLWLNRGAPLTLDLEASYEDTCRTLRID